MPKPNNRATRHLRPLRYHKYNYTPLPPPITTDTTTLNHTTSTPPSDTPIRLLILHPSPSASFPLQTTLLTTTLSTAPPYTALSYSWGDPTGLQPILVDTSYIFVTPNLKHALQRLRPVRDEPEVVLWVDAICIDQENVQERSAQTAVMRRIYERAESVAVWLGLESRSSGYAMRLVKDLTILPSHEIAPFLLSTPEIEEDLRALVSLFRRKYFWRIWVVQEVSAARKATVYCGDARIGWEEFDGVCDLLLQNEEALLSLFYRNLSCIRTLTHGGPRKMKVSRQTNREGEQPALLELLYSHKGKNSTDPKDKVYALIGISASERSFGKIDYELSEKEVFTYTARHIIQESGKLDVICAKQCQVNQYGLPSWVPDWTRPRIEEGEGALVIGLQHRDPAFAAAGDSEAVVEFLGDGYVLGVRGLRIGVVKDVGKAYRKKGSPGDAGPVLEVFHDWWERFAKAFGEDVERTAAFARCITCGTWKDDDEGLVGKLEKIFALSEGLSSGFFEGTNGEGFSRSSTMSNSVGSLAEEDEFGEGAAAIDDGEGEKTMFSTILSAGLLMNRRRLFISEEGLVGLAPWDAESGDLICVLFGCKFPVVLRRRGNEYVLIGEAYVEGFMDGEAMVGLRDGMFQAEALEIH